MSASRKDYFDDLLGDCFAAIDDAQRLNNDDRVRLAAALIVSDGLNGLRKAMLQTQPQRPAVRVVND